MADPARAKTGARAALTFAYVTNFGALAASTPFLAMHLDAAGFSPPVAAQLLAALTLVRVVALPGWTLLADRTHTIGGVLRVVSVGALLAFAVLLLPTGHAVIALTLLTFAVFRAPFAALLDTLLLRDVGSAQQAFGAVRAWGTAGYAVAAVATGALVARDGSRAVITASLVLLGASLVASLTVRGDASPVAHDAHGTVKLLTSLVKRPRVVLLFAVALLQEMGLAPYDSLFPSYLAKLAGAGAAGFAVALGAGAEFLFLFRGARLARRFGPERLLVAACAASTVRWTVIALVTSPTVLVAVQILHALSFGAFYLASVGLMDRETPPSLRASGQGLFGSFAFGVAGALGLSIAGLIERRGGMTWVFGFAACASLVATIAASRLTVPRVDNATSLD